MRFRHQYLAATLAVVAALIAAPAFAQEAPEWSDSALTGFSDVVATGRVVSTEARWDYDVDMIYTYVTLWVDDVMKGDVDGDLIVVKQLGGMVGDLGLRVGGQGTFTDGEETLVFLESRPRDGSYYTSAMWQGKWDIERSAAGEAMAVRGEGSFRAERFLDTFKEQIRGYALASRRSGGERGDSPQGLMPGAGIEVPTFTDWFDGNFLADLGDDDELTAVDDPFAFLGNFWPGKTINATVHKKGFKGAPGKGIALTIMAGEVWEADKKSGAVFNGAKGKINKKKGCLTSATDLLVFIVFKDNCGDIANGGGILAIGGCWVFGSGACAHGFVILNTDNSAVNKLFFTTGACLKAIMIHELGHVYGLAHTNKNKNIMQPFIDNACLTAQRVEGSIFDALGKDDKKGIKKLYPK